MTWGGQRLAYRLCQCRESRGDNRARRFSAGDLRGDVRPCQDPDLPGAGLFLQDLGHTTVGARFQTLRAVDDELFGSQHFAQPAANFAECPGRNGDEDEPCGADHIVEADGGGHAARQGQSGGGAVVGVLPVDPSFPRRLRPPVSGRHSRRAPTMHRRGGAPRAQLLRSAAGGAQFSRDLSPGRHVRQVVPVLVGASLIRRDAARLTGGS